jgi:hypothetical protein
MNQPLLFHQFLLPKPKPILSLLLGLMLLTFGFANAETGDTTSITNIEVNLGPTVYAGNRIQIDFDHSGFDADVDFVAYLKKDDESIRIGDSRAFVNLHTIFANIPGDFEPGEYSLVIYGEKDEQKISPDVMEEYMLTVKHLEITLIDLEGIENVVCMPYTGELTFDVEGNVPEGAEFRAILALGSFEQVVGVVTSNERALQVDFPDDLVNGQYALRIDLYEDDTRLLLGTDHLSLEVVVKIDPSQAVMGTDFGDGEVEIYPEDPLYVYFGGQDFMTYKIVHEESGASLTNWIRIGDHSTNVTLNDYPEGTYRLIARGQAQGVICEDSIVTEASFVLTYKEERDPALFNHGIEGAERTICLFQEDQLEQRFSTQGSFPEGTEFRSVLRFYENGLKEIFVGSVTGDTRIIPLELPEDLPAGEYLIIIAAFVDGEEILRGGVGFNYQIVPEIDPEKPELNFDGEVVICPEESLEVEVTQYQWWMSYRLVHLESKTAVTDWLQAGRQSMKWTLEAPEQGTYQLYAKAEAAHIEGDCQGETLVEAAFTIKHTDEKQIHLSVRMDDNSEIDPIEGRYVLCKDLRLILSAPFKEGGNYYWYKDGKRLDNINKYARQIGVFYERDNNRMGSGTYHVEIYFDDNTGCPYVSDAIVVEFKGSEDYLVEIEAEENLLKATKGLAYQWYKDGKLLEKANERTLLAEESGDYTVKVKQESGCWVMSKVYAFIVSGVEAGALAHGTNIYPNPASSLLVIELGNEMMGEVEVKLFDLAGSEKLSAQTVKSAELASMDLEMGGLPEGVYLVHIAMGGEYIVKKVVKR